MTKIGQLYEKEKIEYGNQIIREIAAKMLKRKMNFKDIMEVTGLTEEELLYLREIKILLCDF